MNTQDKLDIIYKKLKPYMDKSDNDIEMTLEEKLEAAKLYKEFCSIEGREKSVADLTIDLLNEKLAQKDACQEC